MQGTLSRSNGLSTGKVWSFFAANLEIAKATVYLSSKRGKRPPNGAIVAEFVSKLTINKPPARVTAV
jgi:hypothetical protein